MIICRGYEHYARLSMTIRVLCNIHANPASCISWQAADQLSHSSVSRRNITLSEKVCYSFNLHFCEIFYLCGVMQCFPAAEVQFICHCGQWHKGVGQTGAVAPRRSRQGGAKQPHQKYFMTNDHKVSLM